MRSRDVRDVILSPFGSTAEPVTILTRNAMRPRLVRPAKLSMRASPRSPADKIYLDQTAHILRTSQRPNPAKTFPLPCYIEEGRRSQTGIWLRIVNTVILERTSSARTIMPTSALFRRKARTANWLRFVKRPASSSLSLAEHQPRTQWLRFVKRNTCSRHSSQLAPNCKIGRSPRTPVDTQTRRFRQIGFEL